MESRSNTSPAEGAPRLGVPTWHGSEEDLFVRLRDGQPHEAVAYLYDRFSRDVNRWVWRLLGPDNQHDDLVQQVFCELLASARKLRKVSALRAWVMTITVNTVRTELRRRTVRRRYAAPDVDVTRFASVSCDMEGRALLARTFAVLEQLKPDHRLAFSLRYVEGLSLEDTAAACGCSLATIKRRLARAHKRFETLAAKDVALAERLGRGRWVAHE